MRDGDDKARAASRTPLEPSGQTSCGSQSQSAQSATPSKSTAGYISRVTSQQRKGASTRHAVKVTVRPPLSTATSASKSSSSGT
ncbi:hypothetical protein PIIN_08926 [Serendipita indica DSM 11827]|uniref:Uncharacterized protein n=1 Tax=Serendipita indica (strain DSM 11827) TaxID=1109443 RepID=G4TUF3_SERID|nr:hypothetical protein PIIN_08926 [Serendipita indica DSM 11827]